MIQRNGPWASRPVQGLIGDLADHLIRHPNTDFQHKAVAISVIHDRQDSESESHSRGSRSFDTVRQACVVPVFDS